MCVYEREREITVTLTLTLTLSLALTLTLTLTLTLALTCAPLASCGDTPRRSSLTLTLAANRNPYRKP